MNPTKKYLVALGGIQSGHFGTAEQLLRELVAEAPSAAVHNSLGFVLEVTGRRDQAEAQFRAALALDPTHRDARLNVALRVLGRGDLLQGFALFEHRWVGQTTKWPRWRGEPLAGRTIALYAEMGFGDAIQFARYVPMVAALGARVVLVLDPPLDRLARLFATLPATITAEHELDGWQVDYCAALMDLPQRFGTSLQTIPAAIPYLHGDPAFMADVLAFMPGLRVGLCWAGECRADPVAAALDRRRSMSLETMAPLLEVPGCSFVSLQLGPPADQVRDFPQVRDVAHRLRDWSDTANLVAGLDLVIVVDTAVAHLAGALGRPVWLLSRYDGCWRWLEHRSDSPWYPTMRIFRQPAPGDWCTVIADVASFLSQYAFAPCENELSANENFSCFDAWQFR